MVANAGLEMWDGKSKWTDILLLHASDSKTFIGIAISGSDQKIVVNEPAKGKWTNRLIDAGRERSASNRGARCTPFRGGRQINRVRVKTPRTLRQILATILKAIR